MNCDVDEVMESLENEQSSLYYYIFIEVKKLPLQFTKKKIYKEAFCFNNGYECLPHRTTQFPRIVKILSTNLLAGLTGEHQKCFYGDQNKFGEE